nr:hypothetical protein [Elizabethkingia bruuniana]
MQLIFYGILMGVGATLFMDAYAVILKRFLISLPWTIACWVGGLATSEKEFSFIRIFFRQSRLRMKDY